MNDTVSDLRDGESSGEASFEFLIENARRLLQQDTQQQFDALAERQKALKDAESALGELESLRMQLTLERVSQLESALSNLLEKVEQTRRAILQNLK